MVSEAKMAYYNNNNNNNNNNNVLSSSSKTFVNINSRTNDCVLISFKMF